MKLTKKAAEACVCIFEDLTTFERKKMPDSIKHAWKIGKKLCLKQKNEKNKVLSKDTA